MSLLSKLLEKMNVKSKDDLTPEELVTFEKYQRVLTGEVTVASIKKFCEGQIKLIEGKCDGITPLTNVQQGALHVYINLIKAIEAPEAERENLENYLNQIIQS